MASTPPTSSQAAGAPTATPQAPLILGLAGLIPFAGSALLAVFAEASMAEFGITSLGVYAAVILSFLGGVRWGVRVGDRHAVNDLAAMIWSVVPSLVAWSALLLPALPRLILLIGGFALQYWRDRHATRTGELPGWFGRLRLVLTAGALIALLAGLLSLFR